ncbi:hypothetical protein [Methylobacterium oryzisoli]|uniref:hypothetical protein n=1 Tax=Methylobacterium oryzisoli TaxID=3385502 RepID=UPI0038921109
MTPAPHVWRAPVAIGLLMALGLVGALVADGLWDFLWSAMLAGLLAFAGWRAAGNPAPRATSPPPPADSPARPS